MNINETLLDQYSKEFSEKVSNDYFGTNSRIESKDVMNIQPIRQVNLFVIKNLYDQWQRESEKLHSPFFNFQHPEVKQALQQFMNTLSFHVSLDREAYAGLLEKSVRETLVLVFHPYDYYDGLLRGYDDPEIPLNYLKYVGKYMKTNGYIMNRMLEVMEENSLTEISRDRIPWLLDQALQRTTENPVDVESFLAELSNVHPLTLEDVYGGAPVPADLNSDVVPHQPTIEPTQTPEAVEPTFQEEGPAADKTDESGTQDDAGEPDDNHTPASAGFADLKPRISDDGKKSGRNLAEAFASRVDYSFETPEKSILNDILSHEHGENLADLHQNSKISNIKKSLSINQRFMFINSLFQGDERVFERTLEYLESVGTADEAVSFLTHKFSEWDHKSEEVRDFMQHVRRRYL